MDARSKKPVTITSREFNQHTGRAKAAADKGPVIITDRGEPAYVLTSYKDYRVANPAPQPTFRNAAEVFADPNYKPGDPDIMDDIPPRHVEPLRFTFDDEE